MNTKEAGYRVDNASPAAPTGLGMSGQESVSNFQEFSITAQNADNIALWSGVWNRVKSFADIKGQEGSRIRQRTLELVGGLALIASAACGEKENNVAGAATVSATPEVAKTATVEPTPTPGFIRIQIVPETPAPTAAEAPKSSDAEVKNNLVKIINDSGFIDPINAQKILSGDFKDSRFPNDAAAAKRNEYRIYDTQYDYLRTRYYAGDEKALILAKQWREMLKTQFPEMYAQSERLNPTAFEISERGR